MRKTSRKTVSAVIAALMLCCSELTGVGADGLSLLPSFSEIAVQADTDIMKKHPLLLKLFNVPDWQCYGKKIYFSCDSTGRKTTVLSSSYRQKEWDMMWNSLSEHAVPMPAERRILLFRIKASSQTRLDCQYAAILAPGVMAKYSNFPSGTPFRCDYAGIPDELRQRMPSGQFAAAGLPRINKAPYEQIIFFCAAISCTAEKMFLRGEIHFTDSTQSGEMPVIFKKSLTALLIQRGGISPEEAIRFASSFTFRLQKNKLFFETGELPAAMTTATEHHETESTL